MSGKNTIVCASCGAHTHGNFCHQCGNALGGRHCTHCGAEFTGPGKFCSECGAASAESRRERRAAARAAGKSGTAAPNGTDVSWWLAGGSMLALLLVMVWMVGNRSAASGAGAAPLPVPQVPLAQLTPRQTADELFNRVMTAVDNGDVLTRDEFLPLAIQAYDEARPLDMDGVFHMALLHGAAGNHEASLASAGEILEAEPNHILGLVAAAKASIALGRDDEAAAYYQRILDNHDTEIARPLMEYQTHSRYFGVARDEAQVFLAGR